MTDDKRELLPCPFCGSHEIELDCDEGANGGQDTHYVQCNDCLVRGPMTFLGCRDEDDPEEPIDLEAEAVQLWNTRHGGDHD